MSHKNLTKQALLATISWWQDLLFLTVILGGLFFILLGNRPLFVPDEGRYAEIAREMTASGDYLTPHLNGIKYFEKPILFYWLESAAIKVGGLNLWSLRCVNALLALFGCLITYAAARKLYDRRTGLLAALILGTSPLYFLMAHMISLDLPVTVFLAMTLYAFLLGDQENNNCKRRCYFYLAALAAALAVLTKGLIGLVFPLMIIIFWLAITGKWRELKRYYLPSCILIFLLVAAPWHILVGLRNPEFFYFYFIEQHFLRYLTPDVGHYEPVWFFIPCLIIGFFPWILFLPRAVYSCHPDSEQREEEGTPSLLKRSLAAFGMTKKWDKKNLFFLLWALLIFIFFSFSKSKLIPYILPVFPPLAILTGRYLIHHASKKIYYLMLATGLTLLILMGLFSHFDTRTIQPLAMQLKPHLAPEDEVITYNQYYQDLPFYLERRVSILNWKNELSFGIQHQDTHEWMLDNDAFWQRWHSKQHVFVFISNEEYRQLQRHYPHEKIHLLGQTRTTSLISNQPIPAP